MCTVLYNMQTCSCTNHNLHRCSGKHLWFLYLQGRGRWVFVSLRLAWSTLWVLGQPELHYEILSQKWINDDNYRRHCRHHHQELVLSLWFRQSSREIKLTLINLEWPCSVLCRGKNRWHVDPGTVVIEKTVVAAEPWPCAIVENFES